MLILLGTPSKMDPKKKKVEEELKKMLNARVIYLTQQSDLGFEKKGMK